MHRNKVFLTECDTCPEGWCFEPVKGPFMCFDYGSIPKHIETNECPNNQHSRLLAIDICFYETPKECETCPGGECFEVTKEPAVCSIYSSIDPSIQTNLCIHKP